MSDDPNTVREPGIESITDIQDHGGKVHTIQQLVITEIEKTVYQGS